MQPVETKEQAAAFTQVQPEGGEPRRTEEEGQVTDASVGAQPLFQRETATPVKVADPEPVYAEEPEAPQQLAAKLSQALERGDSMVQLQLTPESLGKLTVEITRTAQGQLSVVLTPGSFFRPASSTRLSGGCPAGRNGGCTFCGFSWMPPMCCFWTSLPMTWISRH